MYVIYMSWNWYQFYLLIKTFRMYMYNAEGLYSHLNNYTLIILLNASTLSVYIILLTCCFNRTCLKTLKLTLKEEKSFPKLRYQLQLDCFVKSTVAVSNSIHLTNFVYFPNRSGNYNNSYLQIKEDELVCKINVFFSPWSNKLCTI